MPLLAESRSSKMLGKKKLHQMVDAIPNFPENCGPFVRQNNGNREIYPEVDTQCSVEAVMKKQIDLRVSRQDLKNSAVMCGVSGHGLLTENEHIQKVKQVRETLKLFDDVYTKFLLEDKAEKHQGRSNRRIDIKAVMILKNQKMWVNCEWTFGHVPGVEIGDQFRFRAELVMIGLHRNFIRGISYVNIDRKNVATSIVDSGRYENKTISSETFIYVGQGGNPKVSVNARLEDQKLKGENLALKNSMDLGYPVRVICGRQRVNGQKNDIRYIYYGLYTVTRYWQKRAPTGKYIFKFELKRNVGQPELTRELVSLPAKLVKPHFRTTYQRTKFVVPLVPMNTSLSQELNFSSSAFMEFSLALVVDY